MPWVEDVFNDVDFFDYTKISQKEKLLVPKWDLLEKHVGKGKTKGGLDNCWCKMCSCKE
jgi:hypothetical protein